MNAQGHDGWQGMADLTDRQRRALVVLLSAPSIMAAAELSHTGERTLRRWLADPTFRDCYREQARQLLQDATGQLRALAGKAVHTLRSALDSENEHVRLRAAIAVVETACKFLDLDELTERVAALERGMAPTNNNNVNNNVGMNNGGSTSAP